MKSRLIFKFTSVLFCPLQTKKGLPVYSHKESLIEAIRENQVKTIQCIHLRDSPEGGGRENAWGNCEKKGPPFRSG